MTTIVTRSGKGSPLTREEMDSNLTNLNNNKAETTSPTLTTPIFTGPQISTGDLSFTGLGQRIKGDFSSATVANRTLFQNSNVNANSTIEAIPNGTGTSASWQISNNGNDPANASIANLFINTTEVRLQSTQRGTGTYLPMSFYTGGSLGMQLDSAHNLGVNKVPSGATGFNFIEQAVHATNGGGYRLFSSNGTVEALRMSTDGAGTLGYLYSVANVPVALGSNNTERLRFSGLGEWGLNGANYGTFGQTIISQGAGSAPVWGSPVSLGTAIATTSGTAIDITGIPSYAKRVTLILNRVSTNGSSALRVRLGTSGGVEATGYAGIGTTIYSTALTVSITDGFGLYDNTNTSLWVGVTTFINVAGNTWVCSGHWPNTTTASQQLFGGQKTLAGTLDRLRLTTAKGTDAFDGGSINILWE